MLYISKMIKNGNITILTTSNGVFKFNVGNVFFSSAFTPFVRLFLECTEHVLGISSEAIIRRTRIPASIPALAGIVRVRMVLLQDGHAICICWLPAVIARQQTTDTITAAILNNHWQPPCAQLFSKQVRMALHPPFQRVLRVVFACQRSKGTSPGLAQR